MSSLSTTEKLGGREVKQFSIFLENKVGALLEIVKLLNERNVVVLALSILDSSETSIGRIIVSDPGLVESTFNEHDIPYSTCELTLVELPEGAADLSRVLAALLMAEVNVFFSYPLLTRPRGRAVLALHLDDHDCASNVLQGQSFAILSQADLSR